MVLAGNSVEFIQLFFASTAIGATFVIIGATFTVEEVSRAVDFVSRSQIKYIHPGIPRSLRNPRPESYLRCFSNWISLL